MANSILVTGAAGRVGAVGRTVTELLLTRAAIWMPRGPMDRCIAAFLSAYGAVRPYSAELLWDFVGSRVARYYLEITRPGASRARIGGVPVLTGKLQRLTASVLNERPEHVMPQLPLRLHSARSF